MFIAGTGAGEDGTPVATLTAGDALGAVGAGPRVVQRRPDEDHRGEAPTAAAGLKVPAFGQFTEYELLKAADALREEAFGDGVVVFRQGDRGNKFYLVAEGTAVCTIARDNGTSVEVARLSDGSYFGEVSAKRNRGVCRCLF